MHPLLHDCTWMCFKPLHQGDTKNGKKVWITSTLKRLPFLTKLKLVQQIPDHVLSKKNTGSRIIKQFSGVYVSTQQIINLTSCSLFIYLRKEKTKGFKLSNEQNSRVGKHLSVRSSSIIKIQTNPCYSCTYYLLPQPPVINYRFKAAAGQQLTP